MFSLSDGVKCMKFLDTKIYLDSEGYNEYLENIKELHNENKNNSKLKTSSYEAAVGDGWHDNFDFEEANRIEISLAAKINNRKLDISKIVIVKKENFGSSLVNLGDKVVLKFFFDEEEEINNYRLTGGYNPKEYNGYCDITLNSPIGKAIYKQKVGKTLEYNVGEKKYRVQIMKKLEV
jgi:transcription elongation GreA/GreB family factor